VRLLLLVVVMVMVLMGKGARTGTGTGMGMGIRRRTRLSMGDGLGLVVGVRMVLIQGMLGRWRIEILFSALSDRMAACLPCVCLVAVYACSM
jgi:hypothetical protein